MIRLALGASNDQLVLHGTGIQAPFLGALYERGGSDSDLVEDPLDLSLEGTPSQLSTGLAELEVWLERARQRHQDGCGKPVYLEIQEAEGEAEYSSPVLDGWVERLKGQRSAGSMVVRLHLLRQNWWEDPVPISLLISNLHGASQYALRVDNHTDAAHSNAVTLEAGQVFAGLPQPLILTIKNTSASACGDLWVSLHSHLEPGGAEFNSWLEGEASAGGTPVADPSSSAGQYASVQWSGPNPAQLLTWTLDPLLLETGGGRFYRILARFATPLAYTDLWLRFQILNAASPVWEGPWVIAHPGQDLQELVTLQIPPYLLDLAPLQALALSLSGRRASPGAHSLALDFLQLSPLDGWRHLVPTAGGLPAGKTLSDDSRRRLVYENISGYQSGYIGEGGPLLLNPGQRHRLVFLHLAADGHTAPIDRTLEVRLSACPRYRRI